MSFLDCANLLIKKSFSPASPSKKGDTGISVHMSAILLQMSAKLSFQKVITVKIDLNKI